MHLFLSSKYLFQNLKNKWNGMNVYRKNLSLFQTLGTFPLPDFSDVRLPDGKCSCMTPQGICTTKNYIIITAYCNIKRFQKELARSKNISEDQTTKTTTAKETYEQIKNEQAHSSCLMIFDKKSHRYLALLELPDKNHVGGITYDGTYLWIAKSTKNCLSIILEKDLDRTVTMLLKGSSKKEGQSKNISFSKEEIFYQNHKIPSGKINYFQKEIPCGMTASFVTYFNQRIWVGYCAPVRKKGVLRSFSIQINLHDKKTPVSLMSEKELEIPAKANGASFYEKNTFSKKTNKKQTTIYLFLSISGGRKNSSKMLLYTVDLLGGAKLHSHLDDCFLLPPLLEESCIDGNILYTIYESSSPAYRDVPKNHCPYPVDTVNMADADLKSNRRSAFADRRPVDTL